MNVIAPYRRVLGLDGAGRFVTAGAVARLPIAMLGIGIVLLVESSTGSYGLAGAVAAAYGLVQSMAAPVVARAVDRFGQARVMRPAIVVHVLGIGLLVVTQHLRMPLWTAFAAAALTGATMGSIGALVRARWSHVLAGHPERASRLHTAYSLESALDEAVFIVGPIVVTLLATQVSPVAGLLVAATAVAVGGTALLAQRSTEPPPSGVRQARGNGVLRHPGMVVLVVAFVCVGGIFGGIEVVTVAFTEERGAPGAAGVVLAAFALGSLLAGLAYGAVTWASPVARRFVAGVVLLAAGTVPVAFAESVPVLAALGFVLGLSISPMIIAGTALVQELVAPSRLTEGLTWASTAMSLGTAAGAAASGAAVDAVGAHRAFLLPVVAGALAATVAVVGARLLSRAGPAAG